VETSSEMRALLREHIVIDEAGLGNIWPLFYNTDLFNRIIIDLAAPFEGKVTKVAGIESRGFLLGAAVAARLEVGFVAIRKSEGLYPGPTFDARSASDYRGHMHTFRIQQAAAGVEDSVGLVDDWFETGSQAIIAKKLIEQTGAKYAGSSIIVNQLDPKRRELISPCHSIVEAEHLYFPGQN
jgi:adenine phosphoribosyltransferase